MRSAAGRGGLRRDRRGIAEERRGVAGWERRDGARRRAGQSRAGMRCDAGRGGATGRGGQGKGAAERGGSARQGSGEAGWGAAEEREHAPPYSVGAESAESVSRLPRRRPASEARAGVGRYNDILNTYNPIARRCRNYLHTICGDSTAAPRLFPLADCSPLPRMRHRSLRAQLAPI